MTYWKFTKSKKGFEVTKKDGQKEYYLGNTKANIFLSLRAMSQALREGDIVDTGMAKEDIVFWYEPQESFVKLPKGFTNNTVLMPALKEGECN